MGCVRAMDARINYTNNMHSVCTEELDEVGPGVVKRGKKIKKLQDIIAKFPSCNERFHHVEGCISCGAPASGSTNAPRLLLVAMKHMHMVQMNHTEEYAE